MSVCIATFDNTATVGKLFVSIMVAMTRQRNLLHLVGAATSTRRLASLLDRRQQQPDQNPDDGDHHQKFNQSERPAA